VTLGPTMRWIPITGVALAAAMWFGAVPAQASHVACGGTITADTTLDSDLLGCPNNGIVIGADDITLDLDGHTVAGDSEQVEACPENEFCDAGLLNDAHDGVTVRDGSVSGFDIGAFVGRARDNRVLGVSSSRNLFFGFVVIESTHSLVRNSAGVHNVTPEGDGMGVFGSDHIRIIDNTFRDNPLGLHVEDSTDNLIKGNGFTGNGLFLQADRNQVKRNRFEGGGAGILVAPGNENVIARNRLVDGQGIGIEKGRGNLVVRNVVVDAHRVGIQLGRDEPEQIGGANNVVRRNLVKGSGGKGFIVASTDKHGVLKRNVAVGSRADGFDTASRSTKLTGNRALRNGDLGIEAVRGVIDGGGNKARGNGDGRQCTHVACG
jgi:parallel beta-helix repeat protein